MFRRLFSIAVVVGVGFYLVNSGAVAKIADTVQSSVSEQVANSPSVATAVKAKDKAVARRQLAKLPVRSAASMKGYSRDSFKHWRDPDSNGCDAREDTLARDKKSGKTVKCTTTGLWIDPYGGERFTVARSLDIDHIVPLANAWRSGAARWGEAQKTRFANDPRNLLAVPASLNRQKGDKGPEAWLPPNRSYRATYAVAWIKVKSQYKLSVTRAEKAALAKLIK